VVIGLNGSHLCCHVTDSVSMRVFLCVHSPGSEGACSCRPSKVIASCRTVCGHWSEQQSLGVRFVLSCYRVCICACVSVCTAWV